MQSKKMRTKNDFPSTFFFLVFHLFNKYLLYSYYVWGTLRSAKNTHTHTFDIASTFNLIMDNECL